MKHAIFLGAGFSRAWGLPVMSEFFKHSIQTERLTNDDKGFVRDLKRRAREGASMLEGPENNLEHILSFALMAQGLHHSGDPGKRTDFDKLCLILHRIYSDFPVTKLDSYIGKFDALLGIGRGQQSNDEYVIITTNYDVIPEFLLKRKGLHPFLPCPWKPIVTPLNQRAQSLYATGASPVMLCKLHGSLNWYDKDDDFAQFHIMDRVLPGECRGEDREYRSVSLPEVCFGEFKPPSPPIIMPPMFFKATSDRRFDPIWKAAGDALATANRVIFVGYSFPQSDSHMRYFLAAHLVRNIDLDRISIVDPLADDICERLKESDFGTTFKQLLFPVKGTWQ